MPDRASIDGSGQLLTHTGLHHAASDAGSATPARNETRTTAAVHAPVRHLIFGGVFERLPTLRVAFAHGGGSFPATVARVQHGFDVRPDLCAIDNDKPPRSYLGRFWVDSLVHDPDMLRYLIKLVGERRVALGSDYPFPLGEHVPGSLIESMPDLGPETKAALLGGSALEWLGLREEQFR